MSDPTPPSPVPTPHAPLPSIGALSVTGIAATTLAGAFVTIVSFIVKLKYNTELPDGMVQALQTIFTSLVLGAAIILHVILHRLGVTKELNEQ